MPGAPWEPPRMVGTAGIDRPRSRDVSIGRFSRPCRLLRRAGGTVALTQLMGCSDLGILNPAGPIAAANREILLNALAIMLVIVVPTIIGTAGLRLVVPRLQHQGALPAGLRLFRAHRAHRLVDSPPGHPVSRRRDLDRLARARPIDADHVVRASRSRCRSSRSIGSGCSSIPTRASPASTSSSSRPACRSISR